MLNAFSLWDALDLTPGRHEAAKPKRPVADAPAQVPMRPREAGQKAPSTDQKKTRRAMAQGVRKSAAGMPAGSTYKVYTVAQIPFDKGKAFADAHWGRGGLVSVTDWATSYASLDRIFSSPSVIEADDGMVTLNVTNARDFSAKHPLDGTKYRTQDEAQRAAYQAGLLGWMVYDADQPDGFTSARKTRDDNEDDLPYDERASEQQAAYDDEWPPMRQSGAKKEHPMSQPTEAQILAAMAKATPAERARLVAALDDQRSQRRVARQDARDVDLANTVVRAHLTPIAVHERVTAETDWIGSLATPAGDPTLAMKTAATNWYRKVSAEVKSDGEEFAIQAQGQAQRSAGGFGESAPAAQRAFLDHVAHLYSVEGHGPLAKQADLVDDIIRYESGEMDDDETVEFFQGLIDSGLVGQLQGSYGRMAQSLINAGLCHDAGTTAAKVAHSAAFEAGFTDALSGARKASADPEYMQGYNMGATQMWQDTLASKRASSDDPLGEQNGYATSSQTEYTALDPVTDKPAFSETGWDTGASTLNEPQGADGDDEGVVASRKTADGVPLVKIDRGEARRRYNSGQPIAAADETWWFDQGGTGPVFTKDRLVQDYGPEWADFDYADRNSHMNGSGMSYAKPVEGARKRASAWQTWSDYGEDGVATTTPSGSIGWVIQQGKGMFLFGIDMKTLGYKDNVEDAKAAVEGLSANSGSNRMGAKVAFTGTPYNGWTNWDTWNAGLWLGNDYDLYQRAMAASSPQALRAVYEDEAQSNEMDNADASNVNWQEVYDNFHDDGTTAAKRASRKTADEEADFDKQNGYADSSLTPITDTTSVADPAPAFDEDAGLDLTEDGQDAADVASVPTPGDANGYPQPKGAARKQADHIFEPAYQQGHTDGYNANPPTRTDAAYVAGYRDGWALGVQYGAIVSPTEPPLGTTATFRARVQAGLVGLDLSKVASMSKQDFVGVANALKTSGASEDTCNAIASYCATTNAYFDRGRFLAACGY